MPARLIFLVSKQSQQLLDSQVIQPIAPKHAQDLQGWLAAVANNLHDTFPNLKLAYYSSRTYGGYAQGLSLTNPEPYAYESGFSVQWLMTAQIGGDASLNFDPQKGAVRAPWLSWGPYLWADGMNPRCDGLIWECSDFNDADGTHLTPQGRAKVVKLMLDFLKTDGTARQWYLAKP